MEMLDIQGLSKSYSEGHNVLIDINVSFVENKRYAIVGETGSGKSSLLKLMAGLEQIDIGTIQYKGEKIKGPLDQLLPGHPKIAYLSQDYKLPKLISVEEYLFDPYKMTDEEAKQVYVSCHVETFLNNQTHELSGGERQRVALAKQLMKQPELLLLDEPFSNLDHHHKMLVKATLLEIEKTFKTNIILVAHDPVDVLSWAEKVIVLRKGKVIQTGTPKDLYSRPLDEYVAGLFGDYNLISKDLFITLDEKKYSKCQDKYIVRPEDMVLSKTRTDGIKGVITEINYMGAYDEIVVSCDGVQILTTGSVGGYGIGEKVELLLK